MGMPMNPKEFLESPSLPGPQPCVRDHYKNALCHTPPFGGVNNK